MAIHEKGARDVSRSQQHNYYHHNKLHLLQDRHTHASLAEKITIPSIENDDADYRTNNPGDSVEAQNTYTLNPLVLSVSLTT